LWVFWGKGGNYAARPGNIKVVAVAAALLLPPPQRKFQLYFELSAVCSYANMRNCISRSQHAVSRWSERDGCTAAERDGSTIEAKKQKYIGVAAAFVGFGF